MRRLAAPRRAGRSTYVSRFFTTTADEFHFFTKGTGRSSRRALVGGLAPRERGFSLVQYPSMGHKWTTRGGSAHERALRGGGGRAIERVVVPLGELAHGDRKVGREAEQERLAVGPLHLLSGRVEAIVSSRNASRSDSYIYLVVKWRQSYRTTAFLNSGGLMSIIVESSNAC